MKKSKNKHHNYEEDRDDWGEDERLEGRKMHKKDLRELRKFKHDHSG